MLVFGDEMKEQAGRKEGNSELLGVMDGITTGARGFHWRPFLRRVSGSLLLRWSSMLDSFNAGMASTACAFPEAAVGLDRLIAAGRLSRFDALCRCGTFSF